MEAGAIQLPKLEKISHIKKQLELTFYLMYDLNPVFDLKNKIYLR